MVNIFFLLNLCAKIILNLLLLRVCVCVCVCVCVLQDMLCFGGNSALSIKASTFPTPTETRGTYT